MPTKKKLLIMIIIIITTATTTIAFKQFVGNLATNYLSVFDHFVGLVLKRLISYSISDLHFLNYWKMYMKLEEFQICYPQIEWLFRHPKLLIKLQPI